MAKQTPPHSARDRQPTIVRRRFLGIAGAVVALGLVGAPALIASTPAQAQSQQEIAQNIADHFSSVKTMTGDFVQFGPRGEQTGGTFHISRPGKMRFNYEQPSPVRMISDGESVVIGNTKLNTWDVYPLSKTPLNLLLSERIDLSGSMVKSVDVQPDLITIVLGDKSMFGDSTITMMFDPNSYELKQWTMVDAQGKETTVMIMNVQTGVQFASNVFQVPYDQLRGGTMRN
ncbi:outer membrane lipoprotein carrier protein LolA [Pararhizobium haloflavum]|uniref:outer membrane lipoprotein carrier protein LolA n=1 Tax=Pararhizobium haloflavum TaxID=2037914 RepID=UPI000C18806D|nr:outer membrane lipoprotein carrier protein LolA [Pararhizobium haloflavum]